MIHSKNKILKQHLNPLKKAHLVQCNDLTYPIPSSGVTCKQRLKRATDPKSKTIRFKGKHLWWNSFLAVLKVERGTMQCWSLLDCGKCFSLKFDKTDRVISKPDILLPWHLDHEVNIINDGWWHQKSNW